MPLFAPVFREVNYARITQLDQTGMTPQTIAHIIRDETQSEVRLTPADIRSYLKVQGAASKRMLISKPAMKEVVQQPLDPQPE
ncbi:hypothetical protein [Pseudomonas oryzihabitans]|uniref:hypothetical protein n=1 Tax=Pseudomonas oryzihabitans TaxID=47885 RepID=UPI00285BFC76|nr:hypothetical protein [Pseudomonas psychrotolerans]MDR6680169.1 hypothetical protein [Pseudomonas psychrotolerans]